METAMKNTVLQTEPSPPGIMLNAVGRIWKTSPSPAAGSNPIANTAGKIASPAIIATIVSRPISWRTLLGRLVPFLT